MRKTAHIIVGLGYGDEGKGLVTDYYCKRSKSTAIVIRFNGGQQAGHTVYTKDGLKHVFSNLGVGTYSNIPTYWSKYCSFSPGFFLEELEELRQPIYFFLDKESPITTHYDILFNQALQKSDRVSRHTSCGLGVGPTFQRHKELKVKLTAKDLLRKKEALWKLKYIRAYYKQKIQQETDFLFFAFDHDREDENFERLLDEFNKLIDKGTVKLVTENEIFGVTSVWSDYIFEGAQGILLDQTFGGRPFVTKSNTTSRNAVELIRRNFKVNEVDVTVAFVTRAYLTRHGAGPFKKVRPKMKLKNAFSETNRYNDFQGKFKISYLDLDLLNYAVSCDEKYSRKFQKELFITCLDHVNPSKIPVFVDGRKRTISFETIQTFLSIDIANIHYSFSRFAEDLH